MVKTELFEIQFPVMIHHIHRKHIWKRCR